MSAEFNNHPLVDLKKLFLDDPVEILRLHQEFETNGWCFARLAQYVLLMNIDATLQHVSQLIGDLTYCLKPIIKKLAVLNHQASKRVELSDIEMLDIVQYFNEKTGPTKTPSSWL